MIAQVIVQPSIWVESGITIRKVRDVYLFKFEIPPRSTATYRDPAVMPRSQLAAPAYDDGSDSRRDQHHKRGQQEGTTQSRCAHKHRHAGFHQRVREHGDDDGARRNFETPRICRRKIRHR